MATSKLDLEKHVATLLNIQKEHPEHKTAIQDVNGSKIWSLVGRYGWIIDIDLEWLVWSVHRYGCWWVDMDGSYIWILVDMDGS